MRFGRNLIFHYFLNENDTDWLSWMEQWLKISKVGVINVLKEMSRMRIVH